MTVLQIFEEEVGTLLMLLILLDIFLTVLYARMGTGIISSRLARLVWMLFRGVSKLLRRQRASTLSFCGPTIVILLVLIWTFGLTCGAALIIHPKLGTSVRASSGSTPTDFLTALYTGGNSVSVVGSSTFTPQTSGFRIFYLFNSLIGMSVVSLTLTYLMQIYNALQQRNTFGLKLYLMTSNTADAAELLAKLGPQGQFSSGSSNLADLAAGMTQVKEMHHFYPVLLYFRFREPRYSVSMSALVALDMLTLLKAALCEQEYGWLKESASVSQLWEAALLLVTSLDATFLSRSNEQAREQPDRATQERWRRRYLCALERLNRAGIRITDAKERGAAAYISMRADWDPYIVRLAPFMGYSMSEIDPAGSRD